MKRAFLILLAVVAFAACGVHSQRKAINDARLGLIATGEALHVADKAVDDIWGPMPIEDTDAYCKEMKASLVLEQTRQLLFAGADSVFVWELALEHFEKSKGTPEEPIAWADVLNSQAEWFLVASNIIGTLDAARKFVEMLGWKMPAKVERIWSLAISLSPNPPGKATEWDWSSIKDSICAPQP